MTAHFLSPVRKDAPMGTICPNCGKHDNIYLRSGGALVCRACFVTETVMGSWLALPELRQVRSGEAEMTQ